MRIVLFLTAVFAVVALNNGAKRSVRRQAYEHFLQKVHNDPHFKQLVADRLAAKSETEEKEPTPMFKCEGSKSDTVPTSVNALLPGDIRIVGALGDSISAGNGILAETLIEVILNQRGHVYSAGGFGTYDGGVITLPNILKNYNRDLYGYSTGEGGVDDPEAVFNVAIGGSTAGNLPLQAEDIISKMTDDLEVDMDKDWKMITIFIGGNDLCRVCDDEETFSPAEFIRHMEETLNILSNGLKRTIVNVIPIMDITPLAQVSEDIICDGIQLIACACGVEEENKEFVQRIQREYSTLTENLINSGRYDRDDFAVVYQPFMRDAKLPKKENGEIDTGIFSPDCFHFSEKGHKGMAKSLWINLFEPVGQKTTTTSFAEEIQCPAKGKLIATNANSRTDQGWGGHKAAASAYASSQINPSGKTGSSSSLTILAIVGTVSGLLALAGVGVMLYWNRRRDAQMAA